MENERLAQQEELAEARRLALLEERVQESRSILSEDIRRELVPASQSQKASAEAAGTVDDTDGLNPEEELAEWKLRELQRIKREKDTREEIEREKREVEERRKQFEDADKLRKLETEVRKSTEEQRSSKTKHRFLQKYYHKGAFFMDTDDEVLKRDYDAPTVEETVDRTLLPEVMQVKDFGKIGRTKWTHLSKEDTTARDAGWAQRNPSASKLVTKQGGMHGGFEKPRGHKRKRADD